MASPAMTEKFPSQSGTGPNENQKSRRKAVEEHPYSGRERHHNQPKGNTKLQTLWFLIRRRLLASVVAVKQEFTSRLACMIAAGHSLISQLKASRHNNANHSVVQTAEKLGPQP
jgi:hypothetical protein